MYEAPLIPSVTTPARRVVAAAASGLASACLYCGGGPPRATLLSIFAASLVCLLPGVVDPHLALRYGYGAGLGCQAALFAPLARGASSRLLLAAYALYGLKAVAFQALRDRTPGYVAKVLVPARGREPRGFSSKRLPGVLAGAVMLSSFSVHLHSVVTGRAGGAAVGAAAALASLLVQALADAQKYSFKKYFGADKLCVQGLWSRSRHPNHLCELLFHAGVLLAALAATGSAAAAALSLLNSGIAIWLVLGATSRLETGQLQEYGDVPDYRDYVLRTPRLFPKLFGRGGFAPRGPGEASSSSASLLADVAPIVESLKESQLGRVSDEISEIVKDETRLEVQRREEEDLAASEINNIVGITVGTGVITAALAVGSSFLITLALGG